ncbi:TRAP transporter large permease subunit [uncultured Mailhella sp.]|uniref:TRAP transporter large permease n=1 Tax=uncultured Mailhella sp. TaxID=1981031 RepID=UPI0026168F8A|nr:TRAP transporter large permease subunit [uncultured Mailhella sp.]
MTLNQSEVVPQGLTLVRSCVGLLKPLEGVCRKVSALGMFFFLLMVFITALDVFLRYFFSSPLSGTVEITEFFMVIVFFTSVAHAQWTGGHIVMDVVTAKLSARAQDLLAVSTSCWSVVTVSACLAAMCQYASQCELFSPTLNIPVAPFVWLACAGCLLLVLTLVHDFLASLLKVHDRYGTGLLLLSLLLAAVTTAAFLWFALHRARGIPAVTLGIWGCVFMFFLFFSGMPVAYALIASAGVFISAMRGTTAAWNMLGQFWYNTVASYDWSPLMFFLLMGYVCFQGRFGQDLYRAARSWMGHWRGGLATGSVCACTAFGAVVGDSLAGSVAMSAIALPEMRKSGYDDALAIGCLACSGTIGSLIPPSTTFILYGVLAEQSIGELFIAGIIPGLLCMFCFIGVIVIWSRLNPAAAPASPRVPRSEALASLHSALPILAIFTLVIGGIYGGVFTATEGGGVGVFGMLALAFFLRRMTRDKLSKALNDAGKFTAMCFALLAGANLLGNFMTLSRIPMVLANAIAALDIAPMLVMLAIIIVLCFLGCFIPAIPLVLICVPIFVPIAKVFGWNLVWFGVISTLVKNMACITPPFGINLFVMKGIADVPIGLMYKASLPYVVGLFICVGLIVAFPQMSLWLPSMMH